MRRTLILAAVVAASAYVIRFGLGEGQPGQVAFDTYGYFYPNMLYALRSLAAGGRGLLWNPFQNCGQPFLAVTETGLFYPLNLFFLVTDPQTALRAVLFTNLLIGGLGAYGLQRELGVGPIGSLGGALAFVLANSTYALTTWMPTVQAPYVWMPVAMLCCERLVKAPSLTQALLLAMVLAVGLLPGHPQFVLFTCQLIALRLLWSVFDRSERRHAPRALGGFALALVVMLLLTAVQFFPSLQLAAESVRHTSLTADEIAPGGDQTWEAIAKGIDQHSSLAPFSIVQAVLAAAAIVGARRRRVVFFYLGAGILFLTLSFGFKTALGRLYYELPVASFFREPLRFQFVTGFCVSVLVGFGIDVMGEGGWGGLALAGAALAALHAWLGYLSPIDWGIAGAVLAGGLLVVTSRLARPLGLLMLVGAVALGPVVAPTWTTQRFLADDGPLRVHADLFERLRARLTPQDRVLLAMPAEHDAGFEDKTAQLFALPAITDYETQMTRRYADYITMLRKGRIWEGINPVYFAGPWDTQRAKWHLVDLAAARYVVIPKRFDSALAPPNHAPLTLVDSDDTLRVYENPSALPRAYYVPAIDVLFFPEARLRFLSESAGRRHVLLDAVPPSGLFGVPGNRATADVSFVVDEPEHVVLQTVAPERGFVFLADEYFPAWSATVNGQPTPILPANHTFRLVEVPQGPVVVEFRYESRRVWVGAVVSAVTLLVVVGVLRWTLRPTASNVMPQGGASRP